MSQMSRETLDGQLSGYWLERDRPTPPRPSYEATGAVFPRIGETKLADFVCLDLVLIDAGTRFVWVPLSDVGRYTYAHSLGLLYDEPWRLVVYDRGGVIDEYDATYDESLPPERIVHYYGPGPAMRARQDYPAVQLRLRRRGRP